MPLIFCLLTCTLNASTINKSLESSPPDNKPVEIDDEVHGHCLEEVNYTPFPTAQAHKSLFGQRLSCYRYKLPPFSMIQADQLGTGGNYGLWDDCLYTQPTLQLAPTVWRNQITGLRYLRAGQQIPFVLWLHLWTQDCY